MKLFKKEKATTKITNQPWFGGKDLVKTLNKMLGCKPEPEATNLELASDFIKSKATASKDATVKASKWLANLRIVDQRDSASK